MTITYALMSKFEDACENMPERAATIRKANVKRLLTQPNGAVVGVEYVKDGQAFQEHGTVILATPQAVPPRALGPAHHQRRPLHRGRHQDVHGRGWQHHPHGQGAR
jgi:hypothetical protein